MRWCDTLRAGSGKEAFNPLKMKKKHNAFIEHYLIPVALFLLNICLVHVVYVYTAGTMSMLSKVALTLTLALLAGSLVFKKKVLLASSILLYAIVAIVV